MNRTTLPTTCAARMACDIVGRALICASFNVTVADCNRPPPTLSTILDSEPSTVFRRVSYSTPSRYTSEPSGVNFTRSMVMSHSHLHPPNDLMSYALQLVSSPILLLDAPSHGSTASDRHTARLEELKQAFLGVTHQPLLSTIAWLVVLSIQLVDAQSTTHTVPSVLRVVLVPNRGRMKQSDDILLREYHWPLDRRCTE